MGLVSTGKVQMAPGGAVKSGQAPAADGSQVIVTVGKVPPPPDKKLPSGNWNWVVDIRVHHLGILALAMPSMKRFSTATLPAGTWPVLVTVSV